MTVCIGLLAVGGAGCAKKADRKQCHSACERIARLQTAALQKDLMTGLHEGEERVEAYEDQAKSEIARIKREMTQPTVEPDLRHAKMSAADRRKVAERVEFEATQLKQQRELAIKSHEDNLRAEQKSYAEAKQRATLQMKKAVDDAVAACDARCDQRSAAEVECLLKTQALEDIAICGRK